MRTDRGGVLRVGVVGRNDNEGHQDKVIGDVLDDKGAEA